MFRECKEQDHEKCRCLTCINTHCCIPSKKKVCGFCFLDVDIRPEPLCVNDELNAYVDWIKAVMI